MLVGGVSALAIFAIVYLEQIALARGIDGVALSLAIAAIAGLGGYNLQQFLQRRP
jgi:hypothetical protein